MRIFYNLGVEQREVVDDTVEVDCVRSIILGSLTDPESKKKDFLPDRLKILSFEYFTYLLLLKHLLLWKWSQLHIGASPVGILFFRSSNMSEIVSIHLSEVLLFSSYSLPWLHWSSDDKGAVRIFKPYRPIQSVRITRLRDEVWHFWGLDLRATLKGVTFPVILCSSTTLGDIHVIQA